MLQVDNLCIEVKQKNTLLENINFKLHLGEAIGITGHSGSGKTTLVKSILGMLDEDLKVKSGSILLNDLDLLKLKGRERRDINGSLIGYIPQSPMTAFDSRMKIGKQMIETFMLRLGKDKKEAVILSEKQLQKVNLIETARIMNAYPSELSGGMLQRVAVAIILGMKPQYILADEPTSALDEENRNLLIEIMKKDMEQMGILLISHDVAALEKLCTQVIILSNGKIIEEGTIGEILERPKELWTKKFAAQNKKQNLGEWQWMDY